MNTDAKGTKILARSFFHQLRSGGYTSNEIIAVAAELIDLVTSDLREGEKPLAAAKAAATPPEQDRRQAL